MRSRKGEKINEMCSDLQEKGTLSSRQLHRITIGTCPFLCPSAVVYSGYFSPAY
jgi:hypothetical protein